ncbi:MAG: LysM peptidoglycan-binding domain-containing protein [Anaerolineales bacterium]|nr:LysM peptidoglycan-binding domain-containing protein [Anaerolineales bacterium]
MRKFGLVLIVLLLVSCGSSEETSVNNLPVELPTTAAPANLDLEGEIDSSADSPRGSGSVDESGLPPTFTPMPTSAREIATVEVELNAEGTPLAVTPAFNDQQTYTIQAGDTLAEIAAAYSVSVEALADANGITDPDQIEVGQVLRIP